MEIKVTGTVAYLSHREQLIKALNYDRYIFDRQLQLSVGYKFTNNITVDLSRAEIREQAKKGSLLGVFVYYLYKF
ncbi:MAG: hypothetical protein ACKO47_05515 [Alphaproteobacteria bacterium]